LQRVHFFTGQLLSAKDFQDEQAYHREQRRRHNLAFHATGIVEGLAVTCAGGRVQVAPGLALDCLGREICVPAPAEVTLAGMRAATIYVVVSYAERGTGFIPNPGGGDSGVLPGRIEETYELALGPAPKPHGRRGPGWLGCREDHPMPLGRLLRSGGRWSVDARYRRPVAA
jgi:hypothetical protein